VIVEVEHDDAFHPLGILVNAVNEVLPVEDSRIEARPTFGTRIRHDFVEALLNLGDRFVIALDVQQTLSVDEMSSLAAHWGGGPSAPSVPPNA
jgi:purine-binding chemotaxis protein CheW